MMSKPTRDDLAAVAIERLLRQAFEDGAKWVAQVDDPARSRFSMDRGFAEFRESHYEAIAAIHQVGSVPVVEGEASDSTRRSAAKKEQPPSGQEPTR